MLFDFLWNMILLNNKSYRFHFSSSHLLYLEHGITLIILWLLNSVLLDVKTHLHASKPAEGLFVF